MRIIRKADLLLIPRVTDMRNGLFRPEVAFSKGRASDIVFGGLHENKERAALPAWQAAMLATLSTAGATALWDETSRSIAACQQLAEVLAGMI